MGKGYLPHCNQRRGLCKHQQRRDDVQEHSSSHRDISWDEYGGRGTTPATTTTSSSGDVAATAAATSHDQVAYMSKLAKERAEKRRQEDEAREVEQREKAAQRLRALDEKMVTTTNPTTTPTPTAGSNNVAAVRNGGEKIPTRTLWEPDNIDSKSKTAVSISKITTREKNNAVLRAAGSELLSQLQKAAPAKEAPPPTQVQRESSSAAAAATDEPIIHLTSYEDRDRGERGRVTSTAPRMLFDPKSGSMVAVKARAEDHRSGGGSDAAAAAAADRTNRRNKERKAMKEAAKTVRTKPISNNSDHSVERGGTAKSGRRGKGRKEDLDHPLAQSRDKSTIVSKKTELKNKKSVNSQVISH